ncbi:MAG: hypothetical protein KIT84_13075 [Labilithrix sp.]|nr:hypothetical protein [Labilithrix sp.]
MLPSILDALGSSELKQHWLTFMRSADEVAKARARVEHWENIAAQQKRRPYELTQAEAALDAAKERQAQASKIVDGDVGRLSVAASTTTARDAVTILSMALRADLEAIAMIPTVIYQSTEVIRSGQDVVTAAGALIQLAPQLPAAKDALTQDVRVLEEMVEKLGKQVNQSKDEMAGYLLKESLVDDIAGITLGWLHVRAHAGLDVLIFSPASIKEQTSEEKKSYDYTGRLRRGEYQIDPIFLANANLAIGFDSFRLPEVGKITAGYKTDRQWKSGGSIETGSLGGQLGLDRRTSDLLDLGLQITGARSNVRIASFDAGNFRYLDANTGAELASSPFRVRYTQVDVGYDVGWLLRNPNVNVAYVGFRYLDYRLPRLLYELEDQAPPGSDEQRFTYFNEAAPQLTTSRYYLGGLEGEFTVNKHGTIVPYALLAAYFGGGPVSFIMRRSKAVDCPFGATTPGCVSFLDPADSNKVNTNSGAIVGSLGLGARLRFFAGERFTLYGDASYRGDLIYATTDLGKSEDGKAHIIEFGGTDILHTIKLGINANY